MQLSFLKKTILTYQAGGYEAAADILGIHHAKLVKVSSMSEARNKPCNGILLLGGQDINPFWYGEESRYNHTPSKDRDSIEWTLARRALGDNIPIMGICRGHQLLTVAAGGSLWQDITKQKVTKHHPGVHTVTAKDPLKRYLPELTVNSRHHQAVKTVPYGWKVLATSLDGVTEAVWKPGALGVQWHPEDLFYQNYHWHGLFEWFVNGLGA